MAKGVSPLIATTAIIVLVFVIAALVGPWMYQLASDITQTTGNETTHQIECNYAGYDLDSNYATNGVNWTPALGTLYAQVKNTGTRNLYGFSFEVKMNTTIIQTFSPTTITARTESNPLKPGQTALFNASITMGLANTTVNSVKIISSACPTIGPEAVEL
jgi:outer membrane receptor protein involved in Fe transport